MVLFILYVVLQTCLCHAKTTQKMSAVTAKPVLDRNIYKKTAEYIYLINNIHHDYEDDNQKGVDMDYFNIRNSKEMALKQLMKLLQKNYDASKLHTNQPKVRVHVISNPEVLKQFQKVIKEKESQDSFDDYDSTSNNKLKQILNSLRRQAVFRIDDPASEEKLVEEQQNAEVIQQSGEVTTDKIIQEETGIQNSRKKEVESKEKVDTWDIITKKLDWNKDNWDAKDKKDWGGNEGNISEEDKKKDSKKTDGMKWDDWEGKKDKSSKWDQGQDTKKNVDKWDDWGQKKDKKDKKKDSVKLDYWEQNDKNWDDKIDKGSNKKKNVDKYDDWGQKKDKEESQWDNIGQDKKKDSWDDWGEKKKDPVKSWDEFDKPKPKKSKVDIKWDEPRHKRKGSETKDKKPSEWDTKWNKKDNWDTWDKTTRQQRRTTKRQNKASFKINEWDHYVPKMQNKPKRHELERNIPAGAFGRTSIPFVGKKGIYEEK